MMTDTIISTIDDVYNLIHAGNELSTKFSYSHSKKTNGRVINLTLGRIWLNMLLPDDYPIINEPVDKKRLDALVIDLYRKYGTNKASKIVTQLQSEAFKLATLSPNTFNIDVFIPPQSWVKKKEEFQKRAHKLSPIEFKKEAEALTKELLTKHIHNSQFRIQNVISSGAKGDPIADWGVLLATKGYVIDVEGNLLGPIIHSLNDGYDKPEFYYSAAEARKNFFMRSSLTAHPGLISSPV